MASRSWANVVTQKKAIDFHGLKRRLTPEFVIMANIAFEVKINDQNKKWQIYKTGLSIKDPAKLLASLKEQHLLFEIEDPEWIKKNLDLAELADSVYSSDIVPIKWTQLPWIEQVFSTDEDALFVALLRCNDIVLKPSWLLDNFRNHAYISFFIRRQLKIEALAFEEYFKELSTTTSQEFTFRHLIGTGMLYDTSCDFLKKVLNEEYYNLAIDERLDKLEL